MDIEFELKIPGIYQLKVPFMSVYTSVFLIDAEDEWIMVDAATTADDVDGIIFPAIKGLGVEPSRITKLILTHSHSDHAGGAPRIKELLPQIRIISAKISEAQAASSNLSASDEVCAPNLKKGAKQVADASDDALSEVARGIFAYPLPGHTADFIGVFDQRTGSLISGDSLQGEGIGMYRCMVSRKADYLASLAKLRADKRIKNLLFSHAYEPWYKDHMFGRAEVLTCLDVCEVCVHKAHP